MKHFDITSGEVDMPLIDTGNVNVASMPATTMMLASSTSTKNLDKLYATMGVCLPTSSTNVDLTSLSVSDVAESAFGHKEFPLYMQDLGKFSDFAELTATTQVLQVPKFGVLIETPGGGANPKNISYEYKPNVGYSGNDKAVFLVTFGEYKVNVIYFIKVTKEALYQGNHDTEKVYKKYCPKPSEWLISSVPNSMEQATGLDGVNWFNKNISGVVFNDLTGSAVGETKGTGITAQITLDTNAAGHGWFIDDTPDNNDEFLPTSDSEVWIAKAGTAAAGKMDMLSVLLHEYGHALGIEHSGDNADYMAASWQPGQRRLPSTEELSLMSRLVAALKVGTDDPNDPMNPNLPLSSLGLMALCRIRRAEYGWTLGVDKAQFVSRVDVTNVLQRASQLAQSQTVVNSTLNQDNPQVR
jgi:hypothetical protein